MLTKLNQYSKIKQIIGIEVILLDDGKYTINCVQLSARKNILVIENSFSALQSFGELRKEEFKNLAFSISINGRGVLHKKVLDKFKDDKKAIQSLLPNAKAEDFYIQECPSNKGYYYSVIRKQTLDKILKDINDLGLTIIHVNLGPFAVTNLFPLLKETYSLSFAGHSFTIKNQLLEDYFYSKDEAGEDEIQIDEQSVKESLLVAYASAFQILFPIADLIEVTLENVELAKEEFASKQIFNFAGWGILTFFLAILLVNFFLFGYLREENKVLVSDYSKFNGLIGNLDTLQKKIKQKENFLLKAGWLENSPISYYSDKLASIVPSSILLTELSINPIDQALSRQEKKNVFTSGTINIVGICNKPTDLNPWIKNMNNLEWVEKVQVNNYIFDDSEKKGTFLITIYIK